jgi:hypothetical protein
MGAVFLLPKAEIYFIIMAFMKYVISILVIALIGVSLFGFAGMTHSGGHAGSGCVASAMLSSSVCLGGDNSIFSSLFHLSAYQFLSSALAILFSAISLLIAFSLTLWLFLKLIGTRLGLKKRATYLNRIFAESADFIHSGIRNFVRWLSLLENSPARA